MSPGPAFRVGFIVDERADLSGAIEVIPSVDNEPLTDLIHAFERDHGYEPLDGYGGIIPSFFRFGPLDAHYLGRSAPQSFAKVPLLGCDCGEWGCWPLLATIHATDETATWSDFEQPYRKRREYTDFGPFVFDRAQYDEALAHLNRTLGESNG